MASVTLYPRPESHQPSIVINPFPQLLQTPSGLAIMDLQGTINLPPADQDEPREAVPVGHIDFPDFRPDVLDVGSGMAWMRRVHMYVGQHQQLTGRVEKLPKPLAVVRRRGGADAREAMSVEGLEVVEIVKYKIVFSQRPEPVGTMQLSV